MGSSEPSTRASAQQSHQQEDEPLTEKQQARLAEAALTKLPVQVLSKTCIADVCPVCQDTMDVGESVRRLPCAHMFHAECIARWFHVKLTCPLDGLPVTESSSESCKDRRSVDVPSRVGR